MLAGIDFSTVSFDEAPYLWLLVPSGILLVLLIWQFLRRRRDTWSYSHMRVLPLRQDYTLAGDLPFWLCLIIAASFCIVALARPHARISVGRRVAADIVILQDGSASMYVKDVTPDRWQRSVQFLRAFAEALRWDGDRLALALFASFASPQVRLTKDPNAFFFFLDHLGAKSPFRLEDDPTWDTNIEEGVSWGLKLVEKDEELFGQTKNPKAFVVISDGQAWSGQVAVALRAARARDIAVHVVGVGTTAGGFIPAAPAPTSGTANDVLPVSSSRLTPLRAVLDRGSLRAVARAGGGEYFEIGREPDRDVAFKIISSVRRRAHAGHQEESREELYWHFLVAAAIFLCLGTFVLEQGAELLWYAAGALIAACVLATVIR